MTEMVVSGADVLNMLIPQGGWVINGNEYSGIQFLQCDPISEEEFEAGFALYPAWKTEQDAQQALAKAQAEAKLEALGLTSEDLKALGL
jgi:hypothetical protein